MDRRIAVAPMMAWTDRHARYFLRLIAPQILLYTEMVTAHAVVYGDTAHLLQFDQKEHPLALQLGGCEPSLLAKAAKRGEDFAYDEVNLNVGCPSTRVQVGRFGACLMREPALVADCVSAMKAVVKIPVTVKCRIGVDEQDAYEDLSRFVEMVATAGCATFIVHARKAWLQGLSPKANRDLPPLRYEIVEQLKQAFPELTIIINGGIKTAAAVDKHLKTVDGVMIGREAYTNPYFLAELNQKYYSPNQTPLSRFAVIEKFLPYVEAELKKKTRLSSITRHILGLFHGMKGAKSWRRYLSEHAHQVNAGVNVLQEGVKSCLQPSL